MKIVCYYLAILNLVDGILTFIGLKLNVIGEANVGMKMIYEASPIYFLVVKFILSALLSALCYYEKIPNRKGIKMISFVGGFLYTCVMFLHVYWVVEFLY